MRAKQTPGTSEAVVEAIRQNIWELAVCDSKPTPAPLREADVQEHKYKHRLQNKLCDELKEAIRPSCQADVLVKEKHFPKGSKMNHSGEAVLLNSFNNTRKIS